MLLPSVLPAIPALADNTATKEQVTAALSFGKVTNPDQTPIFICAFSNCHRLFPSRDRLMIHRKREHDSEDTSHIISWNHT